MPSPLPSGGTTCPASPSTAASLVGLCPITSAPPSPRTPPPPRPRPPPTPPRPPLDEVGVDCPRGTRVRALPGCLGRLPPPVLDRGQQTSRHGDGDVVLAGGMPQDFQHLGSAGGTGGHECCIRRVQPFPADCL